MSEMGSRIACYLIDIAAVNLALASSAA